MNENLYFNVTTYGPNGEWGTFTVSLPDLADKDKIPAIQREALCGRVIEERDKLDEVARRRWAAWKARWAPSKAQGAEWPRTEEVCAAEKRLHALWDAVLAEPAFCAYDVRIRIVHEARYALAALARIELCAALEAAAGGGL